MMVSVVCQRNSHMSDALSFFFSLHFIFICYTRRRKILLDMSFTTGLVHREENATFWTRFFFFFSWNAVL